MMLRRSLVPRENPSRVRRREFSEIPSLPMDATAKRVLASFVAMQGKTAERAIKARYDFSLMAFKKSGYDLKYTFAVKPRDGAETFSQWASWHRRPRLHENEVSFAYDIPPGSLADVPEIDGMVYRGMSWEEWQSIRKHCAIRSRGEWNLGQDGLTFFGRAGTAQYYATGFAPWAFKPSKRRPSVVIAIPREYVLGWRDDKRIPESEFAVLGTLPASKIAHAWRVVPTLIEGGYAEVMASSWKDDTRIQTGSRSDVMVAEKAIVPMSLRELSACAAHENPARRRDVRR